MSFELAIPRYRETLRSCPIVRPPEWALHDPDEHFILDEAQELPRCFRSCAVTWHECRKRNGQVVLLGFRFSEINGAFSESLVVRVGFLEMTPFQWKEITPKKTLRLQDLWLRGGFPDSTLTKNPEARRDWFEGYTRTFIERDLSALGIDVSPVQMRKLWTMLAHFNGQIWNASQLASSMGTSYHTVNRYTDILEKPFSSESCRRTMSISASVS